MAKGQEIVSIIKKQIEQFGTQINLVDVGTVIGVGDGIARIYGLAGVKYNEMLQFPGDVMGIALNLEEDSVAAILLGDAGNIKEGDEVRATGKIAEVPVGEALIGGLLTRWEDRWTARVLLKQKYPSTRKSCSQRCFKKIS